MPSNTAFCRNGMNNICVFYAQTNGDKSQEIFNKAWKKVKEWTSVSNEDLHQKFKPYLS